MNCQWRVFFFFLLSFSFFNIVVSFAAGTNQPDKDAELYQATQEDKEQGDFVDYGWASIGSFDDLDRIFR